MARRYGRAPRGERLIGRVRDGHWKTMTFVAGLRCDGFCAPFVIDAPMNGEIFHVYVERCLAPALPPGGLVVMGNLPAHRVAGVAQRIEAAGARLLYLPKYSPDLDPIENATCGSFQRSSYALACPERRPPPTLLRPAVSAMKVGDDCRPVLTDVSFPICLSRLIRRRGRCDGWLGGPRSGATCFLFLQALLCAMLILKALNHLWSGLHSLPVHNRVLLVRSS